MKEPEWWKKSVVYQIYPKSFQDSNGDGIGDINGIIGHLDYLEKLGVDVIWLNPMYVSPQIDNGYDIANYRAIDPIFGTMEDFDRLLQAAHQHHLKIILDLVVNHTSDQHPWFKAAEDKNDPHHDYYIWKDGKKGKTPNNWGSYFGGSAWTYNENLAQYYLHLFAKQQPDLNWKNPRVREEVYDLMKFWLDKGIDGFRMDVINLISKRSYKDGPQNGDEKYGSSQPETANGPRIHEFLHEMNQEVLSKYDIMTVGEMPHTNPEEAVRYTQPASEELNMIFQFEHMGLDTENYGKFTPKRFKLDDLKRVLSRWQTELSAKGGWNSLYWSNHDQPRPTTRFGNDKQYRIESAKMLGTLLHMMQGTPYVFEGEEIGMTNARFNSIDEYQDLETLNGYRELIEVQKQTPEQALAGIYAKSRDNARTPMPWNGEDKGGFTTGTPWLKLNPNFKEINVHDTLKDPNSVFYYYQQLIEMRHNLAVITDGIYELNDDNPEMFNFIRENKRQKLIVQCSFANHEISYRSSQLRANDKLILSNYETNKENIFNPYEARVYVQNKVKNVIII
ncbi:alpha-glucosidase [Pediococcus claussenii]|uniref:alpha-glucosidase n=1 Tax=Pediococcus claussenii TaxID=187452 RepID=UPI0002DBD584|nr:alpha-glucosidase [Pediococcus claussenii]